MSIVISLLPVLLFLFFLISFDSFKLVKKTDLLFCFMWGALSSSAGYFLNNFFIDLFRIEFTDYSRYVAPFFEEILKAAFLFFLLYKGRIGFMIDGAILGFAIGTGFAFIENIYYLQTLQTDNIAVWIVRGFGTAVMHGGAASLLGIISVRTEEQYNLKFILLGLLTAIIIHLLYNQFFVSPVISALILFFLLPAVIISIFRQNEDSLRRWLEIEFDTEIKIIRMMTDGKFSETKAGQYIISIRNRFAPEVIVDMLCYIRIYTELSIRAKSIMLLKETGFPVDKDDDVTDKLKELKNLQKNIGKTGILAISPVLRMSSKNVWKLNQLT